MPTHSLVPIEYDYLWIAQEAAATIMGQSVRGSINPTGGLEISDTETHVLIHYNPEAFEAFTALLDNYETAYVPVAALAKTKEVTALRKEKVTQFSFGGINLELDYITEARLTSAALYLERNVSVLELNWDMGVGVFATLPRANVLALADAAGAYVQNCFNNSKDLIEAINLATTLTELAAIDILVGWP